MTFRHVVEKRSHEQWTLKPQDFLLGLAMAVRSQMPVSNDQLGVTVSGFRDSMARLKAARLVSVFDGAPNIVLPAFRPFAVFAAPYCWPAVLGDIVQGQRTAFIDGDDFSNEQDMYVWPEKSGEYVGRAILPFHGAVPKAARSNVGLGRALKLFDAIRVESGVLRDDAMAQMQSLLSMPR